MLKSTYRTAQTQSDDSPLPIGWTEHKAPTGHKYYYNATTKQSTYTRPAPEPEAAEEDLQIDYNATAPDQVVQASIKALDEFHKHNYAGPSAHVQGHFTGGKSYQDRTRRDKYQDRPKSKAAIPNCEPWLLVRTKFGRRFVHNIETKESFWKFPQDVMMAVIEMDKVEWQAKRDANEKQITENEKAAETNVEATYPVARKDLEPQPGEDYDSDEYEEVEVTDEEDMDDAVASKRPRMDGPEHADPSATQQPVEFDEDDIAYQLAQMEADGDEDGYYADDYPPEGDGRDHDNIDRGGEGDDNNDDEDGGLPLTAEDSQALFRSLLDDYHLDPFSTFDAIIEDNDSVSATTTSIIDDPRWTSLPNMSSRRSAFTNWSRDRIAAQKQREEANDNDNDNDTTGASTAAANNKKKSKKSTSDPRITYLNFLVDNATPKLYWPEFKRKFRKEPAMKDLNFPDRDREKLYREYVSKLKMSGADRKKEFRDVLKSIPMSEEWNRDVDLDVDGVPDSLERDVRYYLVRDRKMRDELVKGHLETLR